MKLKVIERHQGEGVFPTFLKGTLVQHIQPCTSYPNWLSCSIDGWKTYVPIHFVENHRLTRDYNPTELQVEMGVLVDLLELHYQWVLVNYDGQVGWLPTEVLRTAEF